MIRALFYSFLGTAILFLLLPLLMSCSEPHQSAPIGRHWAEGARPVSVMVADCQDATAQAVRFWADHGVTYLEVHEVGHDHRAVNGVPGYREIGVYKAILEPGTLAQTGWWHGRDPAELRSAEVVIEESAPCIPANIAHELGHALGLEDEWDLDQIRAVMFGALDVNNPPPLDVLTVSVEDLEAVK